jgi:DNA-binding CsgD family transcriptional regulator
MLGRALRLKGTLAGGDEGVESLREAVTVLRRSDNELELARALVRLGTMSDDESEAAAALQEGELHAAACGASSLLRRARDGRGVPTARTAALTEAELRVAGLVARGLSNQSIADELGVTPRAVEKHLTNSYRKLGVSGRSMLVAALAAG